MCKRASSNFRALKPSKCFQRNDSLFQIFVCFRLTGNWIVSRGFDNDFDKQFKPSYTGFFGPYKSMTSLILKSNLKLSEAKKMSCWFQYIFMWPCQLFVYNGILEITSRFLFIFKKSYVMLICQEDIRCIIHGLSQLIIFSHILVSILSYSCILKYHCRRRRHFFV